MIKIIGNDLQKYIKAWWSRKPEIAYLFSVMLPGDQWFHPVTFTTGIYRQKSAQVMQVVRYTCNPRKQGSPDNQ
jgi:hypothetical protein